MIEWPYGILSKPKSRKREIFVFPESISRTYICPHIPIAFILGVNDEESYDIATFEIQKVQFFFGLFLGSEDKYPLLSTRGMFYQDSELRTI